MVTLKVLACVAAFLMLIAAGFGLRTLFIGMTLRALLPDRPDYHVSPFRPASRRRSSARRTSRNRG